MRIRWLFVNFEIRNAPTTTIFANFGDDLVFDRAHSPHFSCLEHTYSQHHDKVLSLFQASATMALSTPTLRFKLYVRDSLPRPGFHLRCLARRRDDTPPKLSSFNAQVSMPLDFALLSLPSLRRLDDGAILSFASRSPLRRLSSFFSFFALDEDGCFVLPVPFFCAPSTIGSAW